jgi:hypothetical protein
MGFSGMSSVVETLLLITRIVKPSTIQLSDIGCALVGVNGSGTLWWSPDLGSGGEYQSG